MTHSQARTMLRRAQLEGNRMTSQHTPGPWQVSITHYKGKPRYWITACPAPNMEREIAEVASGWTPTNSNLANAYLMAAAPELLAACEDMLEVFKGGHAGDMYSGTEQEIVRHLSEIVSKALGPHPTLEANVLSLAMSCQAGRVYWTAKILPADKPRDVHAAIDFLRLDAPNVVDLDETENSEDYLLLFEDDSIYIFHSGLPDSFHPNIHAWLALEGRTLHQENGLMTAFTYRNEEFTP